MNKSEALKLYNQELKRNASLADKEIRFSTFSDLEEKLKSTELVVAFFGANWCKNTARFTPEFLKAQKLSDSLIRDSRYYLTKVECTTDGEIYCTSKFNISGYPTTNVYKNGKFLIEYMGNSEATEFWTYLQNLVAKELHDVLVGPQAMQDLLNAEEMENAVIEESSMSILPLIVFMVLFISGAILFKRARSARNRYTALPRYA